MRPEVQRGAEVGGEPGVDVLHVQHCWQQQAGLQNTGMQAERPQSAIGSGAKQAFGLRCVQLQTRYVYFGERSRYLLDVTTIRVSCCLQSSLKSWQREK
jgi:hypothetical protein